MTIICHALIPDKASCGSGHSSLSLVWHRPSENYNVSILARCAPRICHLTRILIHIIPQLPQSTMQSYTIPTLSSAYYQSEPASSLWVEVISYHEKPKSIPLNQKSIICCKRSACQGPRRRYLQFDRLYAQPSRRCTLERCWVFCVCTSWMMDRVSWHMNWRWLET